VGLFDRIAKDLGQRVRAATAAAKKKAEMDMMAKPVAALSLSNGIKKTYTNGNTHNTGMFAHKSWQINA